MNYKTKQQEIIKRFEELQKEITQISQVMQEKQAELLRFQGEYRLLDELLKKEDNK